MTLYADVRVSAMMFRYGFSVGQPANSGVGSNEAESRSTNRDISAGVSGYLFSAFLGLTGDPLNSVTPFPKKVVEVTREA